MDFMEAVKAMNEGKAVTRRAWDGVTQRIKESNVCPEFEDYLATDWEIVEDKKGFELELREAYDNRCFGDILDVIQHRNIEFIDWCIHHPQHVKLPEIKIFKDKAKEIFGDKLS